LNRGRMADGIEVVGAGPAGLAAAITLARAGRRVRIHEARRAVGGRFGADLQGLENWTGSGDVLDDFRAAGLTTAFENLPCPQGVAIDAWDRRYRMASDGPIFYLVERGPGPRSLDSALLAQAQSLGVEVRFGSRVQGLEGPGIVATGPGRAEALAVGWHFETAMADGFWLLLDDEVAPKGYAYLLVMNGRGTVKSCMFAGFRQQRLYAERTVERFRRLVGLKMDNPRRHGGVGRLYPLASASLSSKAAVGESAGFQDALAGFGMRYAIRSGVLAAQALLDGEDYEMAWRRELARSMQESEVNRALFATLGNRGYRWLLLAQERSGDTRRFLRWLYRPKIWQPGLLRWARHRRRKAGADEGLEVDDLRDPGGDSHHGRGEDAGCGEDAGHDEVAAPRWR
ncbi:MAG: NAD(P)/FAD-dependent oxidoreductase, partial [Gammaproteobacteria bacterium]